MLRYFCLRPRRHLLLFPYHRLFTSSSSSSSKIPIEPSHKLKNPNHILHPAILHQNSLSSLSTTSTLSRNSVLALSATLLSALLASLTLFPSNDSQSKPNPNSLYTTIEHTIQRSNDSFKRIFDHIRQTGVAASVLWQSLSSVLSSANHEVRVGFELRVAALLADIAAANAGRRAAIVGAGGGAVVDWLLETVAVGKDGGGTQAEAARALAYLIADPDVCKDVLRRPHAVTYLLRFIFSCHPQRSKKVSFLLFYFILIICLILYEFNMVA